MSRKMKRNHSTALPQAIVLLDTETVSESVAYKPLDSVLKLYFGKARYIRFRGKTESVRDEITFTTPVQLWEWLLPKLYAKTTTWMFAHNLGFDLTLCDFWQLLEARILSLAKPGTQQRWRDKRTGEWQQRQALYVDADPPTIIGCYTANGGNLLCIDTMNYWPVALDKIGQSVGLPKLRRPSYAAPDDVWAEYCQRDIDILERAVLGLIAWIRDNDYGKFRWTAASQAMAAYRHRLGDIDIDFDRPNNVQAVERQAYYGGRVEILRSGQIDNDVFELDVSSMYPSVMVDNYFPCKLSSSYLTKGNYNVSDWNPRLFTAAECLVESANTPYPARMRDGTYYCVGRFWTTLCGADLRAAWDAGHVRAIARWSRYRMQKLFAGYVEHFWQQRERYRQQGMMLQEQLCKLMLNSLYGKFGQLAPRWEDCVPVDEHWQWGQVIHRNADTGEKIAYRSIGGHIQRSVPPTEHKRSFAAIAAWVTAYARERMRQLVQIAGNGNVYYVVNDALYVNRTGLINLQMSGEVQPGVLGKLRQKRYGKSAAFTAANHYRIGDDVVVSGVNGNATQLSPSVYREEHFERISETIARRPEAVIHIRSRVKVLLAKVKRAYVRSDGWTMPITLIADQPQHLAALRRRPQPYTLTEFAALPPPQLDMGFDHTAANGDCIAFRR